TLSKEQEVLLMSPTTPQNTLAQMNVLKKLFPNVTNTNFNYFTFKVEAKVVTLTAKQGFVFGKTVEAGKPTLVAPAYTISKPPITDTNLGINAIPPTANITTEDINNLKGTDTAKKITTLLKLFRGIDSNNYSRFDLKINESSKTITLTAHTGFIFGSGTSAKKSIDSQAFTEEFVILPIIAHTANLNLTADDVKVIKDGNNQTALLTALNKLFSGIVSGNISNITITIDDANNKVTITPNYGYLLENSVPMLEVTYTIV
ncbi:MAG: hypothetical protein ACRDAW_02195, partial [Metamycoplasmataceae bacterium]